MKSFKQALQTLLCGLRNGERKFLGQHDRALIEHPLPEGLVEFPYLQNYWPALFILLWLIPLEIFLGLDIYDAIEQGHKPSEGWPLSALMFLILFPVMLSRLVVLKIALCGGLPVRVSPSHIEFPECKHLSYRMNRLPLAELTFASIMGRRSGHRSLCFGNDKSRFVLVEGQVNPEEFVYLYNVIRHRVIQQKQTPLDPSKV